MKRIFLLLAIVGIAMAAQAQRGKRYFYIPQVKWDSTQVYVLDLDSIQRYTFTEGQEKYLPQLADLKKWKGSKNQIFTKEQRKALKQLRKAFKGKGVTTWNFPDFSQLYIKDASPYHKVIVKDGEGTAIIRFRSQKDLPAILEKIKEIDPDASVIRMGGKEKVAILRNKK